MTVFEMLNILTVLPQKFTVNGNKDLSVRKLYEVLLTLDFNMRTKTHRIKLDHWIENGEECGNITLIGEGD